MHFSRLPHYLYFQRFGGYLGRTLPYYRRAWYCAHQYKNTYSIYIFSAPVTLLNTNLGIRYENVCITKELNNATLTSMSSKRLGPGLYIINSSIRIEAKLSCTLLHMLYVNGMADDIGSVALTLPPGQQYLNHTCIISISEENTNLELRARQDGNSVVTGTSWMIITRIK